MRILIAQDEDGATKSLQTSLLDEGFTIDYVVGQAATTQRIEICSQDYDLVILNIITPKKGALEICREIRRQRIGIPLLLLASSNQNEEIIEGLDAGADDCLAKPFELNMLLAHIRALLRRPTTLLPPTLTAQDVTLDQATKQVYRKRQLVKLTLKEFSLLEYFMRRPNQVVNREQIIANLWDFAFDSFSNIVDVHVAHLRKKMGDKNGCLVETVYGIGYKLNA